MLVEQIMTRKVITVTPDTKLKKALSLTKYNNIRHLPVVEDDRVIGIVSDRDLRSASPPPLLPDKDNILEKLTVKDIMHPNVITVHPMDFVEEAARLLYEHKIGCLPVTKDEYLVGIVTETDILRTLVELLGLFKQGAHLEVEVPHIPGTLAKVAGVVGKHRANIHSILLTEGSTPQTKTIIMRIEALDPRKIIEDIEGLGYRIKWPLKPGEYGE